MKALAIFAVSLVVFGLSLTSFIPGFSMGQYGVYVSSINLIVNALLFIVLVVSLLLVSWKKKDGTKTLGDITSSWLDALAFVALMLTTVIFPAVTILFEGITHTCAEGFFDLIPTPLHFMLLALGPVLNGFCAGLLFQKVDIEPKTVNFLNGMALGISLPFVIATIPMLIFSLLALVSGMAWMVLSAILAFVGSLKLFDLLTVYYPNLKGHGRLRLMGIGCALILLLLVQIPIWLTNMCTLQAAKDPNNKLAFQMIKLFGDKKYLLRKCYLSGNMASINEVGLPAISTNDAQVVFKQVTKKDYKSYPKPPAVEIFESRLRD